MNIQKIDREVKLNQWTEIIRECRSSSQSVRSWCIEHDIDEKRYYYWLRKIRKQACNNIEHSVSTDVNRCEFAQIQPPAAFHQAVPTIKLHIDGIIVEISDGMSQETISYVLNRIRDIC